MTRAVLFTGGGDLSDPWHPFDVTSQRLAAVLEAEGVRVTVLDRVRELASASRGARLLVLNAGSGIERTPHDEALLDVVTAHLAAARPLLAVHAAAGLLPGSSAWEHALGGCWIPEVSGHPPIGEAHVTLEGHELVRGLAEVRAVDERYTGLRIAPGSAPFAWHEEGGERHALAWAHEHAEAGARVVYDGLGHDAHSYDSPSRVALLRAELRWLLAAG